MSFCLRADHVSKSYADRRVLDGVSLTVSAGRRIGLVGENGVGKSTLLRLLAGVEAPDSGEVQRPSDLGFLRQELPFAAETTVDEVIDDALADIRAAQRRMTELGEVLQHSPSDAALLEEFGEVLEWAQRHDLWEAEHRVEVVLAGLGLASVGRERALESLSGGQRCRLALAALMLRQPEVLVLDEPTNHLDDAAVEFLQQRLAAVPGAVVLASHDRVFLDAVCTDIVDLDPSMDGVSRYGGSFSDYLLAKHAERVRWEQRYAVEQEELRSLRHAVAVTARQVSHHRPRGNTSKLAYDYKGARVEKQISRRVRDAQQRLGDLSRTQVRKPPVPLRFSASLTRDVAIDEVLAQVREAVVWDRLRVEQFDVGATDRVLVTGPNGAGKSTLLSLLAGRLRPDAGVVRLRRGLRVGLLEQDVVFSDARRSARQLFEAATAGRRDVPGLAELGLLPPADLDRPVGALSVGQRRRVALAVVLADPPEVLCLDEPTNHLSLTLADELEDAVGQAPGAVVVASHDRWLRRRWDWEVVELSDGRLLGR